MTKTTRYILIEDRIMPDGQQQLVRTINGILAYQITASTSTIVLEGSDFAQVLGVAPGHTYTITEEE